MINAHEMHLFVEVVQQKSFRAAAERLGIPHSTLSRRIKSLETSLGVKLLHRSAHGLTLTDLGQAYYQRCQPLISRFEAANAEINAQQDKVSGVLRITAPPIYGRYQVREWIMSFISTYPDVTVELDLDNHYIDLKAQDIDLAIRRSEQADEQELALPLPPLEYLLAASPAYLAEHGVPKAPFELRKHDGLLFQPPGKARHWRLIHPSGAREEIHMQEKIRVNDFHFLLDACKRGLGIAVLPKLTAQRSLQESLITAVLPEWQLHSATFCLQMATGEFINARTRAFYMHVQNEIARMGSFDK